MIIRGRVVDERGFPVRDVMVYAGDDWCTTDANGNFSLTTKEMYIGAMKSGYLEFKGKIPTFDTKSEMLEIVLVKG